MAQIIVNIYVPSLINIKQNWHFFMGPMHYFNLFTYSKKFFNSVVRLDLLENVKKTLTTNYFHIHPENLLVCMCLDPAQRATAIDFIEQRRAKTYKRLRFFRIPKKIQIKFDTAQAYHELIDINEFKMINWVSPPMLSPYGRKEIEEQKFDEDFMAVPCHSQAVEFYVARTSEAAKNNIGYEERHGWLLNAENSYQETPSKATKSHFVKLLKVKRNIKF